MADLVLRSSFDAGIALLTLNRPERRNALNPALLRALVTELDAVRVDAEVRVVVLTGAGEQAFCAGGDLSPSGMLAAGMLGMHEDRHAFVEVFRAMRGLGKPIVARVQGHCLGGGLGLMLACDLAVAAQSATFGTPEIKVGLFPMMIMAHIFRNVGRKRGMEMILTGERMGAEEAAGMGLVNRVVPDDQLDQAVRELAGRVAGYSPAVLKLGRDAFYAQEDLSFDDAMTYLHTQLTINTLAEDAAEGIAAFIGKREPRWKGR
jgi:enoyl-CoA hydratase